MYTQHRWATKYIKQIWTDIKEETDSSMTIAGHSNIPLMSMERWSRQEINKEVLDLRWIIKLNGINVYLQNIPNKTSRIYIFSSEHGTFSQIDHILGHKKSLKNLTRFRSYQASLPATTVETGSQSLGKNCKKYTNVELNDMQLNNQWVTEEIKKKYT